jgi:hypothetical protein
LVIYHFVIEGGAFVQLPDGQSIELQPGDIVILPHGDAHQMTSGKGAVVTSQTSAILSKVKSRDLSPLQAGGGGDAARFVCGYMACDPYISRPILKGLPRVFKVNIRRDRSGHWLENSILHLSKKQLRDKSAARPCLRSFRRLCSSIPCGGTLPACRNSRWGGSGERAIPSWEKASDCCIAALPIRGQSPIWQMRWAFPDRP